MDYMSARVSLAAATGGISGLTLAHYRGYHFPARTVAHTAMSTAMAATACYGMERIAHHAATTALRLQDGRWSENSLRYASHAAGGLLGGALLGSLYIRKPIRGALFFTPIMLGTAALEHKLAALRQAKQLEFVQQQQQQQQQTAQAQQPRNQEDEANTSSSRQ